MVGTGKYEICIAGRQAQAGVNAAALRQNFFSGKPQILSEDLQLTARGSPISLKVIPFTESQLTTMLTAPTESLHHSTETSV